MKLYGVLVGICFLLAGCMKSNNEQMVRFHDDGRAKPIVSFVPVLEQTQFEFPWSLSDEFTTDIYQRLLKRSRLFLKNQPSHSASSEEKEVEPFMHDLAWMKKTFEGSEYVIFLELVDHHISLVPSKSEPQNEEKRPLSLEMIMRVRVVDLREKSPRIILQEMITQSHHIPKFLSEIDYEKCRWGTKKFQLSPVGIAHRHFIKEVTTRVEDYILLSQSK